MRRYLAMIAAALVPLCAGVVLSRVISPPVEEKSPWGANYIPNLPVQSQNGQTYRFYDDLVKNKTIVVNFIFTGCSQICPLTTARMAEVQAALGDAMGKDVFFYSISLDPLNDTPQALKKFASGFNIGPGWLFLTGKPQDLALIRDRLGERSRDKTEHQALVILANDRTGQWGKDSSMSEISHLVETIKDLDPAWRARVKDLGPVALENRAPTGVNIAGRALFVRACAACHTIGKGDRVGPDLANVSNRRSRDWLIRFISRPDLARKEEDPIAIELFAKYNGVAMPNLGLSETDAADALSYIEFQSQTSKNASAAP